ncbi:hypothetical protein EII19_03280 [Comamonadaceae bacterium OH2310_COT-174]|nr:hypothetical protein EII19_03280 [Comamonadaceae bacterium OH2310_COT-174]
MAGRRSRRRSVFESGCGRGRVFEIRFAKQFFEAKAADARRKCTPGCTSCKHFQRSTCGVLTENTAATLHLNSP